LRTHQIKLLVNTQIIAFIICKTLKFINNHENVTTVIYLKIDSISNLQDSQFSSETN